MSEQTETNCRILLSGGSGQIEEKKSVFIANIARADSEEEATAFIETMKKKYWDARHNCSAFVIGERGELTRCSDDGEPSGTAGRPMLEVLLRENIKNIVVVVTRYFGGTLLGTGGLVRAYTQAVKEGLNDCKIGVLRMGVPLALTTDYNGIGKILYLLSAMGLTPKDSDYGEKVTLQVLVPVEEKERLVRDITEATAGKTEILQENPISYVDNESLYFKINKVCKNVKRHTQKCFPFRRKVVVLMKSHSKTHSNDNPLPARCMKTPLTTKGERLWMKSRNY